MNIRLTALFGDQRFIFDPLHNQSPHTIIAIHIRISHEM